MSTRSPAEKTERFSPQISCADPEEYTYTVKFVETHIKQPHSETCLVRKPGYSQIIDIAVLEQRVVVTKDSDFVNSYTLYNLPERLLLISTGNISNTELEGVFIPNLSDIVKTLSEHRFVELTREKILVHA